MNEKMITVPLGDGFSLAAEPYDCDGYKEVLIGLLDLDGFWMQDLARVGENYRYGENWEVEPLSGQYRIYVYADSNSDDFTDKVVIPVPKSSSLPGELSECLLHIPLDDGCLLAATADKTRIMVWLIDPEHRRCHELAEVGEKYRFDDYTNEPVQDHGKYFVYIENNKDYFDLERYQDPDDLIPVSWLRQQSKSEQDPELQACIEKVIRLWKERG